MAQHRSQWCGFFGLSVEVIPLKRIGKRPNKQGICMAKTQTAVGLLWLIVFPPYVRFRLNVAVAPCLSSCQCIMYGTYLYLRKINQAELKVYHWVVRMYICHPSCDDKNSRYGRLTVTGRGEPFPLPPFRFHARLVKTVLNNKSCNPLDSYLRSCAAILEE